MCAQMLHFVAPCRILASCTDLMQAIKVLVLSSKDLQREIVDSGRVSEPSGNQKNMSIKKRSISDVTEVYVVFAGGCVYERVLRQKLPMD